MAAITAAKPLLRVSVYSDLACPWCWAGARRLDKALAQVRQRVEGRVEWHAYLLDPNFPPGGEEIDAYGLRRFGPGFRAIKQRVVDSGAPDGATFSNWRWRANTLKGHMLVALAREHQKDNEAAELLFRATYEEGKNISSTPVLLEVADKLGLGEEARARLGSGTSSGGGSGASGAAASPTAPAAGAEGAACGLDGGACAAEPAGAPGEEWEDDEGLDGELLRAVQLDDAVAKERLRISGVPFFIIDADGASRRYALSGAQPVNAFVQVFDKVLTEAANGSA